MGKRIRTLDWAITPLGPIEEWPQSLRTVVNILLSSRYAMWMAWGPDLTFLCNDAYRPTLGIKDPWALGARADRVWAEIWPDIGPRIETVLTTGEATYDEGLLLFLERSGFPEETYHTFSYSPLADDHGRINGMLCVVTEETERILGERRVETLRDVASALASTNTEGEVLQALRDQFGKNKKDLPFTLTYLFDEGGRAHLACFTGISPDHQLAAEGLEPDATFPWPAQGIFQRPVPRIEDLFERCETPAPMGDWNKPAEQAVVVPIRQQGQEQPAGFLVVGINPYRRYDEAYSGFVDLLAGQIAAGLANARAYEAERRRAESLAEIDRAKTTFFSNVSHELRTPLTLLLSPVEELLADKQTAGNQRQLLDLVHRNGLRLQRLVNTLLDFSRIEAGRVQAVYESTDLPRYTSELAGSFRSAMEKAGLEFQVECGQPLPDGLCGSRHVGEDCPEPALERIEVYFRGKRSRDVDRERRPCGTARGRYRNRHSRIGAAAYLRAVPQGAGRPGTKHRGYRYRPGAGARASQAARRIDSSGKRSFEGDYFYCENPLWHGATSRGATSRGATSRGATSRRTNCNRMQTCRPPLSMRTFL